MTASNTTVTPHYPSCKPPLQSAFGSFSKAVVTLFGIVTTIQASGGGVPILIPWLSCTLPMPNSQQSAFTPWCWDTTLPFSAQNVILCCSASHMSPDLVNIARQSSTPLSEFRPAYLALWLFCAALAGRASPDNHGGFCKRNSPGRAGHGGSPVQLQLRCHISYDTLPGLALAHASAYQRYRSSLHP